MIKNVFILDNKKIKGIAEEKAKVVKLLKSCGKAVKDSPEGVDLIVTMGGDGTFLKGVRLTGGKKTLLYGIKYGNVGFLTNSARDMETRLASVAAGNFRSSRRMLLEVSVIRDGKRVFDDVCLNEAIFFRQGIRIINIEVAEKREDVFRLRCDGLIVATPTGSTAHSLSAFSPVVTSELECMIVVPVCPHTLSWRPVVLSARNNALSVKVAPSAVLAVDGQRECELSVQDAVIIKKSSKYVNIIMDSDAFFEKMRVKFNWSV